MFQFSNKAKTTQDISTNGGSCYCINYKTDRTLQMFIKCWRHSLINECCIIHNLIKDMLLFLQKYIVIIYLLIQTYIEDAKDEITKLIQENTEKLDQMNMLIVEKKSYEKDLNARQKSLVRLTHLAQL